MATMSKGLQSPNSTNQLKEAVCSGGRRQRAKPIGFAALRRRAGRDGTSLLSLPNLHSTGGQILPPTRLNLEPKICLKCRPSKKDRILSKVGPNGGPESAQFGLKSALAAFLGLLDLKNEPPEGPSEKASNFERFWDPLGRPQLGSPLCLGQISAF